MRRILALLGLLVADSAAFVVQRPSPVQTWQLSATLANTTVPSASTNPPLVRPVAFVEKFARLPVWPVLNGVFLWTVNRVLGDDVAAALEHVMTGRVGPQFYNYQRTSPFILLVHHCHSFWTLDPVRWIQATFFPEGFPAHPHRGFVTLTYILQGGFVHRDSSGIRQEYGSQHRAHSQWLDTGAGLLHEEMFENRSMLLPQRQELYQLWINLPATYKMRTPTSVLLGKDEAPVVQEFENGRLQSTTVVLAGEFRGHVAAAPIATPLLVAHVTLAHRDAKWSIDLPDDFTTALVYTRTSDNLSSQGVRLPAHYTAYFATGPGTIELQGKGDVLFLAGVPINEPCVAQGSMVLTTNEEVNRAYADYQAGEFGRPWSEKLSDQEWLEHVRQYPSRY